MGHGHEHAAYHPTGHEITEKDVKFYLLIFVGLSLMTLAQVIIFQYAGLSHMVNAIVQMVIALVKVILVAYYFMHLKDESTWLKFIAALPVFAVLYTVFIAVETIVR
jgi:cytochrome c oxidase subunit 4